MFGAGRPIDPSPSPHSSYPPMKDIHIVFGVITITLTAVAGAWGAWCWWRAHQSAWFWRLLRASQVAVVIQAALGGVLGGRDVAIDGRRGVYLHACVPRPRIGIDRLNRGHASREGYRRIARNC